jgi:hypothetical protein
VKKSGLVLVGDEDKPGSFVEPEGRMKMDTPHTKQRRFGYLRDLPVSWLTVALFAILIAFADGFWFTSMQGAVGAIQRSQEPFHNWWQDSTVMLPLIFVAVIVALALARRWFGSSRWKFAASAVLVIVVTTGVGLVELTASAAYDYHLQTQQIAFIHGSHVHGNLASPATSASTAPGSCDLICAAKRQTLLAQLRSIKYAGIKILLTNIVLVLWILAIRGGQLWLPQRSAKRDLDAEVSGMPSGAVLA